MVSMVTGIPAASLASAMRATGATPSEDDIGQLTAAVRDCDVVHTVIPQRHTCDYPHHRRMIYTCSFTWSFLCACTCVSRARAVAPPRLPCRLNNVQTCLIYIYIHLYVYIYVCVHTFPPHASQRTLLLLYTLVLMYSTTCVYNGVTLQHCCIGGILRCYRDANTTIHPYSFPFQKMFRRRCLIWLHFKLRLPKRQSFHKKKRTKHSPHLTRTQTGTWRCQS